MINYVTQYGVGELRTVSNDVVVSTEEDQMALLQMVANLVDTVCEHNALGLSSIQIGVPVRMFVMRADMDLPTTPDNLKVVINPFVVSTSPSLSRDVEGCLSFLGTQVSVERPDSIEVSYTNDKGEPVLEVLHGLAARCFLHEYDHLNGVLFIDRAKPLDRTIALKRFNKFRKKYLKSREWSLF